MSLVRIPLHYLNRGPWTKDQFTNFRAFTAEKENRVRVVHGPLEVFQLQPIALFL
jgi:hypothetical protein